MYLKKYVLNNKYITSFAIFNTKQLLYHLPIVQQNTHSSIKFIQLNIHYKQTHNLALQFAQQLLKLILQLNNNEFNTFYDTNFLDKLMAVVMKDANKETKSYHNILYLTLQYYNILINMKYNNKKLVQSPKFIEFLEDIHLLYFKQQKNKDIESIEYIQQLKQQLMICNYDEMLQSLQKRFIEEQNERQQISLVIEIIMKKNQLKYIINNKNNPQNNNTLIQKVFNQLKTKCYKIKKNQNSLYHQIVNVLLQQERSLIKFCNKSWPVYLIHKIDSINFNQKIQNIEEIAKLAFQKLHSKQKMSKQQSQYLISFLIGRKSTFEKYSYLFNLLPPYFVNYITILSDILQLRPVIEHFIDQQFEINILRNLLNQSFKINLKCLIKILSSLVKIKKYQQISLSIVQPFINYQLLYPQIKNQQEINILINNVLLLHDDNFLMIKLAYSQLNITLTKLVQTSTISRELFIIFAICQCHFYQNYDYLAWIGGILVQIFQEQQFSPNIYQIYRLTLNQLQLLPENQKILKNYLQQLQGYLQVYKFIYQLNYQNYLIKKVHIMIQLLSKNQKSIIVLRLILNMVKQCTYQNKIYDQYEANKRNELKKTIKQYINNYANTIHEQQLLIKQIQQYIN